jgi:hypothetical protein
MKNILNSYNKGLILVFLLFISFASKSAHIGGYTLSLLNQKDSLGNPTDLYKLHLRIYMSTNFPVQNYYDVALRSNNGDTLKLTIRLNYLNSVANQHPAANCMPADNNTTHAILNYYSANIDLSNLNDSLGYYIAGNSPCCYNGSVNYSSNSGNQMLFRLEMPAVGINSPYRYNSTPIFTNRPRQYYCTGISTEQNWSATDADNDVIKYKMIQMQSASSNIKPFANEQLNSNYSINNILGSTKALKLDENSGISTFMASNAGAYNVCIVAEEYRNGVKIGEVVSLMHINFLINSTCSSFIEKVPALTYLSDSSATNSNDTIVLGTSKYYLFDAKDNGNINDSIRVAVLSDAGPNSINALDTNNYTWQVLNQSDSVLSTQKSDFYFEAKSNLKFKLNIHPNANALINNPYKFKVLLYDNACGESNTDSHDFNLTFSRYDYINADPVDVNVHRFDSTSFLVGVTNSYGIQYQWQSNFGNGFKNLKEDDNYSGTKTSQLRIRKVDHRNDQQVVRCLMKGFFNVDTSENAKIQLSDSCYNLVIDTNIVLVYDTVLNTIIQTNSIGTFDTLNVKLQLASDTSIYCTVKIFQKGSISNNTIGFEFNNATMFAGHKVEIINALNNVVSSVNFTNGVQDVNFNAWAIAKEFKLHFKDNQQKVLLVKQLIINK